MFLIFVFHVKRKEKESERNKNYWIKQTCQCDGLLPWNHQISVHFTFFSSISSTYIIYMYYTLSRHESHTYLYMKPKSPKRKKKKTTDSISNYITVHFTIRFWNWQHNISFASHRVAYTKLVLIKRIIELSRTLIPHMWVRVFGIWI